MSTKPMRAILIDPHNKTITELDIQPGYDAIKQTIEAPSIDGAPLCKDIDVWFDDEGLYRKDQAFFSLGDDPRRQLIAGRALVLGRDDWETTEAPFYITVEHLNDVIHWYGDAHEAEAAIGLGLVERPYSAVNGEVIWQWSPDQVDGWI